MCTLANEFCLYQISCQQLLKDHLYASYTSAICNGSASSVMKYRLCRVPEKVVEIKIISQGLQRLWVMSHLYFPAQILVIIAIHGHPHCWCLELPRDRFGLSVVRITCMLVFCESYHKHCPIGIKCYLFIIHHNLVDNFW